MSLRESFRIALRTLRANKLRSGLTMIGIVIGIAAVIVLVGLGEGVKSGFTRAFGGLATTILVNKADGEATDGGEIRPLKESDVAALRDRRLVPDVKSVLPVLSGSGPVRAGSREFDATLWGSTDEALSTYNRELSIGSMFTMADVKHAAKVAVIGTDLVDQLFDGDPARAFGANIRISRSTFSVIGIMRSDGNFDDLVVVPLSTARAYLLGGSDTVTTIAAKAASAEQVDTATDQITRLLAERRHIKNAARPDFRVISLRSQVDQIDQFLQYLTLFIVAVAGVSLLVGAVGVANIMLVSTTERTREIGIRKALGARRSTIMKQFLVESAALAGIGGVVGVGLGVSLVLAGEEILQRALPAFGTPSVSMSAIVVALAVSMVIGLVAGCYPAFRAARMRPIEALRYE